MKYPNLIQSLSNKKYRNYFQMHEITICNSISYYGGHIFSCFFPSNIYHQPNMIYAWIRFPADWINNSTVYITCTFIFIMTIKQKHQFRCYYFDINNFLYYSINFHHIFGQEKVILHFGKSSMTTCCTVIRLKKY